MTSSCTQACKQAAQSRIFSLFALASRSPAVSQPLAKLTVCLRTARKRLLSRLPNLRTPAVDLSVINAVVGTVMSPHPWLSVTHSLHLFVCSVHVYLHTCISHYTPLNKRYTTATNVILLEPAIRPTPRWPSRNTSGGIKRHAYLAKGITLTNQSAGLQVNLHLSTSIKLTKFLCKITLSANRK